MALQYRLTTTTIEDLTLELRPEQMAEQAETEIRSTYLPAEWERQSGVQLTWPHKGTDWAPILKEVTECYIRMALEIALRERLIIVTPEPEAVDKLLHERLPKRALENITLHQMPTDDTWARDHGFITLVTNMGCQLLDFQFNGWGKKFPADEDNHINRRLMETGVLNGQYEDHLDFVLEGGSIESDGKGTILTTSQCLLAPNRNINSGEWTVESGERNGLEDSLKRYLRAERVLWLDYGHLAGDDTDGHIDTLARFCPGDAIAYVQCTDESDEHYEELKKMEEQLQGFRTIDGRPYRLIPLPMANGETRNEKGETSEQREQSDACIDYAESQARKTALGDDRRRFQSEATKEGQASGEKLPATYANFLIINGAVLMPTYGDEERDERARRQLQQAFPKHEIVGIDSRALIQQHGSIHCSAMQFPRGAIKGMKLPTISQF